MVSGLERFHCIINSEVIKRTHNPGCNENRSHMYVLCVCVCVCVCDTGLLKQLPQLCEQRLSSVATGGGERERSLLLELQSDILLIISCLCETDIHRKVCVHVGKFVDTYTQSLTHSPIHPPTHTHTLYSLPLYRSYLVVMME